MLASFMLKAVLTAASLALVGGASVHANPFPRELQMAAGPGTLATPQFRRYGVADGLPSGAVYSVTQDNHGLMWFGSIGGLVRFDGISFKVFRHVFNDPASLPANPTYSLFVDRKNRIWAGGVASGLTVYDQSSERFSHWAHDDADAASLASNEVWSIAQTPDGEMWLGTQTGLDRMRADGKGFDHVPRDVGDIHAASFGSTRALLAETDGRLWIGTETGLYLRQADGTLERVPVAPEFHGNIGMVWRIEGGNGEVRVSVTDGLLVIGADGVARPMAGGLLSSRRIVSSTRDTHGRLWIGTTDGVLLDQGDGNLQLIADQPLLPGGLPGNNAWQTMLDREGGLWITFDQSSVAYLPPDWDGFGRYTHIPDDAGSLSGTAASTILLSSDGKLWVGGDGGWVDKLDVSTGRAEHVVRGVRGQVVSMAEDPRGRLWIDAPPALHVYDRGKLVSVDLAPLGVDRPVLVCAGDDGRVYVASWAQGLFVVDPDSLVVAPLPMDSENDAALFPDQLSFQDGRLWYASRGGLQRWDEKAGRLRFVPGVPREEILAFAFDAKGFWLSTVSALEHYHEVDGTAVRDDAIDFSHEELVSDFGALQVDLQNRLWAFANPGLWQLELAARKFVTYGPSQGLTNANFNGGAVAMTRAGVVFAANSGGVVAFQPEQLLQPATAGRQAPRLSLAQINVQRDGKSYALPLDNAVTRLGWRDHDLRAGVRLASFVNPALNRYRFRLTRFDDDWVETGNRGERSFAGLPAGEYTLDVQAAAAGGRWVSLTSPLHIQVQAPPWERWWAWLIYALLAAILVGLILRSWRRRLAQQHHMQLVEQQRQLAEAASAAKTQFLATLSHEIRTPMTGVMGMAELLLSTPLSPLQHDYTQAMQRSGSMLLKLLNDALDLARIEAGKFELEPAAFDPRQLLQDVAQLEQGLAQSKGIRFVLDLDDNLPDQVVGDAVRIKQVLLNLANNALKFTDQGRVTLRGQSTAEGLLFSVSDTGPGIPEASQSRLFQRFEQEAGPQRRAGSGLGLAICRELVDLMGGSIELESRVAHGSTFRVRLPLLAPEQPDLLPAVVDTAGHQYRVLLVEDDAIVAAVICGLLEREGHTVVHVVNGLAALAELAHTDFAAVLLDLDLPGVDGFQIARLIRQREHAGQNLPIVAVTARSDNDAEALAHAAGMDGFLRKPLTGEQLAAALARVIATGNAPG